MRGAIDGGQHVLWTTVICSLDEGWLLDGRYVYVCFNVVGFWLVRTGISDLWIYFMFAVVERVL